MARSVRKSIISPWPCERKEKLAYEASVLFGRWLTRLSPEVNPAGDAAFTPSREPALRSDWRQHVSSAATCPAVERRQPSSAAGADPAQRVGRYLSR